MKKYIIGLIGTIYLSILLNLNLSAQDSRIINEVTASINRTLLFKQYSTEANIGAGIGAYHYFHTDLSADLNLGIEFNYSSQKKTSFTNVMFTKTDINYNTYTISIPANIRYFFEYRRTVFVDMGAFLDLNFYASRNGKVYPYNSWEINEIEKINESIRVMSKLGFAFGLGGKIPLNTYDITVKFEFKICPYPIYKNEVNIYNSYFRLLLGLSRI